MGADLGKGRKENWEEDLMQRGKLTCKTYQRDGETFSNRNANTFCQIILNPAKLPLISVIINLNIFTL